MSDPRHKDMVESMRVVPYAMLAIIIIIVAVASVMRPADSTDTSRWDRSGLSLYTDKATGVQYVKAGLFGGTTVRINSEGAPYLGDK